MKRMMFTILASLMLLCLAACAPELTRPAAEDAAAADTASDTAHDTPDAQTSSQPTEDTLPDNPSSSQPAEDNLPDNPSSAAPEASSEPAAGEGESTETEWEETPVAAQTIFYVTVGENTFTANFADNEGAQALKELLAGGPITLEMRDYGGFEKVGALGQSLPTSNTQITTQAGDIVLYQGDQIVMFYGSNTWSYTQLGKIDDLTGWEEALGSGDLSIVISLS